MAEGAKQTPECDFRDGKVKGEINSIFNLVNRYLKLQVSFCLTQAVKFPLLSRTTSEISSMHGTRLRPQSLGETCEGLVQTRVRHPPKHPAPWWAGVRAGPASQHSHPQGKLLVAQVSQPVPGSWRGRLSSAVCEVQRGYDLPRS